MNDAQAPPANRLCCAKPRKGQRYRSNIWLEEASRADLVSIKDRYQRLLGRPISSTMVFRRGLDLLAGHLALVANEDDRRRERQRLLRYIR